ncbi:MAG: hypothetical protein WBA74_10235 [Cyclobacteriaceae bacterium]
MPNLVQNPFPIYTDVDGDPLEDGYIFIGVAGLNPISNPLQAFWDSELTIPATNIRTRGGYASNNGTPGRLYTDANYSILVKDKKDNIVYSQLDSVDYFNSPSGESSSQTSTIATLRTLIPKTNGYSINVRGYYEIGDVSDIPVYYWDEGSLLDDNGGSVIKPTDLISTSMGRWRWKFTGEVNILWYGAVSTPGIDNSPFLVAALAEHSTVFISSSITGFEISDVTIPTGKKIKGHGKKSILKAYGSLDQPMIKMSNDAFIEGINFVSDDGKDSGLTFQHAIWCLTAYRTNIKNCWAEGISGSVIRYEQTIDVHQGNICSGMNIKSCNIGLEPGPAGEYANFTNCSVTLCNIGVNISGGNVSITNSAINDNAIGVYLRSSANDAHGVISACTINHNVVAVQTEDLISKTFLFNGCMFYFGEINLIDCQGVNFKNCDISSLTINEDGCSECWFKDCHELATVTINPNHNGSISEVFYINCEWNVTTVAGGDRGYNGGFARVSLATRNTAVPVGISTLDWDTWINNSITANPSYQKKYFYGDGSGAIGNGNPFFRTDLNLIHGGALINVQASITMGKTGSAAWNADDVVIRLTNNAGEIVGHFNPTRYNSVGGLNTITYVYQGSVSRIVPFKVEIVNYSAGTVILYEDSPTLFLYTRMLVTGW